MTSLLHVLFRHAVCGGSLCLYQEMPSHRLESRANSKASCLHHGWKQTICNKARLADHHRPPARLSQGATGCRSPVILLTGHLYVMPDPCRVLQLLDALQWCLDLGVEAITVYAFSIDNFRRDPREVEALMCLAEEKLLDLLCVRFVVCCCGQSLLKPYSA